MPTDNHDKIENFQRNVLLARAKVLANADCKNLTKNGAVSNGKIRSKKPSSEKTDDLENENPEDARQTEKIRTTVLPKGNKLMQKSSISPLKDCDLKGKGRDMHIYPKNYLDTSSCSTSPKDTVDISPSSRAPDLKKRKRCNVVDPTSPMHSSNTESLCIGNSNVLPKTDPISQDCGKLRSGMPSGSELSSVGLTNSMASQLNPKPLNDYAQELKELSAQLSSETQSCTLSPMQSKLAYGESRYMKPPPLYEEHRSRESQFYQSNSDFYMPNQDRTCENTVQSASSNIPPGFEHTQLNLGRGFPPEISYSNRSSVSGYLKYFDSESVESGWVAHSSTSGSSNKQLPHGFIGKHPSLVRKLKENERMKMVNTDKAAYFSDYSDSDGEIQKILNDKKQNVNSPIRSSGSQQTCKIDSKHGSKTIPTFNQMDQKLQNPIPFFSQLDKSSSYQYQTPPSGQHRSRVQDGRWSMGSVGSGESESGSPAGRVGRHSSPAGRAGRHSSPASRNRYTGKPRSSNSSPVTREVKISKALTGICRHKHGSEDLMMLEGGYFSVEEILNTSRFKQMSVTKEEVEEIVKNNDKQRFTLKEYEGNLLICANQGHSFEVKGLELERIHSGEEYSGVVHGTYDEAWESIRYQGLSRMNRTHIHFALGLPSNKQVISGMRRDCEVVIYINMGEAIKDGYEFFKSKNNVILCAGNKDGYLPTKYFTSVIRLKGRRQLLQETKPVLTTASADQSQSTSSGSVYYRDQPRNSSNTTSSNNSASYNSASYNASSNTTSSYNTSSNNSYNSASYNPSSYNSTYNSQHREHTANSADFSQNNNITSSVSEADRSVNWRKPSL